MFHRPHEGDDYDQKKPIVIDVKDYNNWTETIINNVKYKKWMCHSLNWQHLRMMQNLMRMSKYVFYGELLFLFGTMTLQLIMIAHREENENNRLFNVFSAILTAGAMALTQVQKKSKYAETAEDHRKSAEVYDQLANDIGAQLSMPPQESQDGIKFYKWLNNEMERYRKYSPVIDIDIEKDYENRCKEYNLPYYDPTSIMTQIDMNKLGSTGVTSLTVDTIFDTDVQRSIQNTIHSEPTTPIPKTISEEESPEEISSESMKAYTLRRLMATD